MAKQTYWSNAHGITQCRLSRATPEATGRCYRASREGDTQQNDDAKYTKFAGHFDGNHDAVVGYQAHRPIKNKRRSRAFLKATKRCRWAITSIVDIGSAKMAEFCALITKKTSPNQPIVKTFPKSTWCEDFGNALTFGQNGSYGCVLSAQKSVHNFA